MNIGFTKMHGLGNDFVVIDNMNGRISLTTEQVVFLCNRFKGIGADGVIMIEPSDKADCFMNYINADGTFGAMCGNGVRCVAKYLKENILKDKTVFTIDSRSGVKETICHDDGTFSANIGKASFSHADFPAEADKPMEIDGFVFHFVAVGPPFAIAFVDKISDYNIATIGEKIGNEKIFPKKMNIELVEEKNKKEFNVLIWERGCGPTLACGTGACAVYTAVRKYKNADAVITTNLPGGPLTISENENGDMIIRGPAENVFSAIVEI